MQIAALNPEYLDENAVPADRVEKEKAILTEQIVDVYKRQLPRSWKTGRCPDGGHRSRRRPSDRW